MAQIEEAMGRKAPLGVPGFRLLVPGRELGPGLGAAAEETPLAYSKKRGLQAAIFHVRETNGISLAKSLSIRCVTLHSSTRNANLFAAQSASQSRFGRSAQVDSHSVMGKVAFGGISTTLRIPLGRGVQRGEPIGLGIEMHCTVWTDHIVPSHPHGWLGASSDPVLCQACGDRESRSLLPR